MTTTKGEEMTVSTEMLTPAEVFPPGEYLRDELEARGWTQSEFAEILARPTQVVSEILNDKKEITPETAVAIGEALGTGAEFWLNLQAAYRLHLVRSHQPDATPVARRARLRSLVPVRELQNRGWLPETEDLDDLEDAVCDLLEIASPNGVPSFALAARRANPEAGLTPEQTAWTARVLKIGRDRVTKPFDQSHVKELGEGLVRRIQDPYDLSELQTWLAEYGVVLVIEQPLKRSKLDGIVLFDDDRRPVVGLTTRGDRLDSFIFTLLHELAHVALGHIQPGTVQVDEALLDERKTDSVDPEWESEANDLAGQWIFPHGLDPGTSRPRMPAILALARSHGVHSSFVIGRLQQDRVLDWHEFRRNVPKVRPFVDFG
jgi:HTH-type transcriptional regulator/antitoxin HigA